MKKAKDDKRLQTIPEGSYEAGAMNLSLIHISEPTRPY